MIVVSMINISSFLDYCLCKLFFVYLTIFVLTSNILYIYLLHASRLLGYVFQPINQTLYITPFGVEDRKEKLRSGSLRAPLRLSS